MPTYDYRCLACGHELEVYQSISEPSKKKCPACKKPRLQRQIGTGAGFLFKGGGFYQTDYRSEAYKQAENAEKSPASPAADASSAATPSTAGADSAIPGGDGASSTDGSPAKSNNGSQPAAKKRKKKESD